MKTPRHAIHSPFNTSTSQSPVNIPNLASGSLNVSARLFNGAIWNKSNALTTLRYCKVSPVLDTDDGIPDYQDIDSDNDGFNEANGTAGVDSNNDGVNCKVIEHHKLI